MHQLLPSTRGVCLLRGKQHVRNGQFRDRRARRFSGGDARNTRPPFSVTWQCSDCQSRDTTYSWFIDLYRIPGAEPATFGR